MCLRVQESVKRKATYYGKTASGYSFWGQREVKFTFISHFQDGILAKMMNENQIKSAFVQFMER